MPLIGALSTSLRSWLWTWASLPNSSCLRDWLSQRWLAKSLEQTCIFELEYSKLHVSRLMLANNVLDAKEKFELWLQAVLADRTKAAQSRG